MLQSCLTLCDPIDGSPPGSAVPGILQARTLEWVAISFSNAWKWRVKVKSLSRVQLLATPWTAAYQAPPSMGFSRQEYWSGVPLPSLMQVIDSHNNTALYIHCYDSDNGMRWYAKSLQSCPTLCDPIDGSPPGSAIPGILQARTLELVAISFSNAWKWKVKVKSLSCVRLLATPWIAAYQAPLSMGFARQEYWSGLPLPSPMCWWGYRKIGTIICWWREYELVQQFLKIVWLFLKLLNIDFLYDSGIPLLVIYPG